jgi:hypothetical protein
MRPKPKSRLCNICNKNEVKNLLFCEDCLSRENRDKTFWGRIRFIVKLNESSKLKSTGRKRKK